MRRGYLIKAFRLPFVPRLRWFCRRPERGEVLDSGRTWIRVRLVDWGCANAGARNKGTSKVLEGARVRNFDAMVLYRCEMKDNFDGKLPRNSKQKAKVEVEVEIELK
jgi:hypothetical protein